MKSFYQLAALTILCAAPLTAQPLTKAQAEETKTRLAAETLAKLKTGRTAEIEAKSITLGDKTLKWLEKDFGKAPEGKRSLWISMHGGGSGPAEMNDGQWQNQIRLYQPKEGIYLAPRAPTNTWNLWHEGHIDPLFERLIEGMIATRGVDPDRVYLMGYSAGGDGVWQLAPRMADRFAAAAMMAGHPNEASLLGLRNLPFAIFMGGEDKAYDRNKIAAQKEKELDALQKADPKGYEHFVKIYKGLPHWMDGKDAEAVPWMAKHVRNPWPDKIVWFQDDVLHDRFYWLELPKATAKPGQKITATAKDNLITLEGDVPEKITLHLSDALVNLDKPILVKINGKESFKGKVDRTTESIRTALESRPDLPACPTATLKLGN
ncbi:MAG: alpha/beta hydrolase [Verrucomicrobiaceae bacterium]|nr:MAG: alpha/beta hydrolase [Verrucomicrobiaceae bacterium]